MSLSAQRCNASRFDPVNTRGHYESWFVRANHPTRRLAFWIRYTIFSPAGEGGAAVGELWAIVFDGERDVTRALKRDVPMEECRFDREGFTVAIDDARLDAHALQGEVRDGAKRIAWSLTYDGGIGPLLLLPDALYERALPRAKALVGDALACFSGRIEVDGEVLDIDRWVGSQNHNWGSRHTDRYAWGQVAGFDDRPDVFLECTTAWLRFGPVFTPPLTVAVLRVGGDTYAFNSPARAPFARASVDGFSWRFETSNGRDRLRAHFEASAREFAGLTYRNPPGGAKICLNCKLARCELELSREGAPPLRCSTAHRAALEMLGDDARGVEVVV